MTRVLRTIIACLLLVALPLQGYAAGAMLFCGAGAPNTAAHDHHYDDDVTAHDHHSTHHHEHAADAGFAADDSNPATLHDVMHGKCSVCSSCCNAAALPSTPIAATTAVPHASEFPDLEHPNLGHRPTLLERPPRQSLA